MSALHSEVRDLLAAGVSVEDLVFVVNERRVLVIELHVDSHSIERLRRSLAKLMKVLEARRSHHQFES